MGKRKKNDRCAAFDEFVSHSQFRAAKYHLLITTHLVHSLHKSYKQFRLRCCGTKRRSARGAIRAEEATTTLTDDSDNNDKSITASQHHSIAHITVSRHSHTTTRMEESAEAHKKAKAKSLRNSRTSSGVRSLVIVSSALLLFCFILIKYLFHPRESCRPFELKRAKSDSGSASSGGTSGKSGCKPGKVIINTRRFRLKCAESTSAGSSAAEQNEKCRERKSNECINEFYCLFRQRRLLDGWSRLQNRRV